MNVLLLLGCVFLRQCVSDPPPGRMEVVVAWHGVDIQFPSTAARNAALADGRYDPSKMSVWSILAHDNRLFIFCPNQFKGTYSTVNFVYMNELSASIPPQMRPYSPTFRNNVTSVFRAVVTCQDRYMYFVDDGVEAFYAERVRRHPPRLYRVDLRCDRLELLYTFLRDVYNDDSTFTNLAVDRCPLGSGLHVVYICDLSQFALVVVDLQRNTCHRVKHPYFVMDPFSAFLVTAAGDRHTFLADGVAALALSESIPYTCDRTLYFACSGGRHVFSVSTATLRNPNSSAESFYHLGYKGDYSQSNNMVYDPTSKVLFYATTQDNSLYCWDTRDVLTPWTQRSLMRDDWMFRTPNDLEVDCDGCMWALANNWVGVLRHGAGASPWGYDIVVLRGVVRDMGALCTLC